MAAERQNDEPRQLWPPTAPAGGAVAKKESPSTPIAKVTNRHAIRLTYSDGFKATVVKNGSSSDRWNFACQLKGESSPRACMFFNGPWGNRCLFKALSHAIQHLFRTGVPPYPVERTLLVSGTLDAAMRSHHQAGAAIDTPQLAIAYSPRDFSAFRENGSSWQIPHAKPRSHSCSHQATTDRRAAAKLLPTRPLCQWEPVWKLRNFPV